MAVLAIIHDLHHEPNRDYEKLRGVLQNYADSFHSYGSIWFVVTNKLPREVFSILEPHLHKMDKVVITPVALEAACWSQSLPQETRDWLANNHGVFWPWESKGHQSKQIINGPWASKMYSPKK